MAFIFSVSNIPLKQISAADNKYTTYKQYYVNLEADGKTPVPSDFGNDTSAGRIWTDKSVTITDTENKAGFDVSLSALAQEYMTTNESNPGLGSGGNTKALMADVTFILDMSTSMNALDINKTETSNEQYRRIEAMTKATNDAIRIVMKANPKNRVAVHWFGGPAKSLHVGTLMEMGSYTLTSSSDYLVYSVSGSTYKITTSFDMYKDGSTNRYSQISAVLSGGTPTQDGITYGVLKTIEDIGNTTYETSGKRQPYVFLLSDGAAISGRKDFYYVPSSNATTPSSYTRSSTANTNYLNDASSSTGSADIAGVTILTGAFMKDKLETAYRTYNNDTTVKSKFYTVGLGSEKAINGNSSSAVYAWAGLDPTTVFLKSTDNTFRLATAVNTHNKIQGYATGGYSKYQTNYTYSDYYKWASTYPQLDEAFAELSSDVEAATTILPLFDFDIGSSLGEGQTAEIASAIAISDNIGTGMSVDIETLKIGNSMAQIDDTLVTDGTAYKFEGYDSKVVINGNKLTWYIDADDMQSHIYRFASRTSPVAGVYTAPTHGLFKLDYMVVPIFTDTPDIIQTKIYYESSGAKAYFKPPSDSPYYIGVDRSAESNLTKNGTLTLDTGIMKSGPETVRVGKPIAYTVDVYNYTDTAKNNLLVTSEGISQTISNIGANSSHSLTFTKNAPGYSVTVNSDLAEIPAYNNLKSNVVATNVEPIPNYTVKFNSNGGIPNPSPVTKPEGNTITAPPVPTREGYTFAGWYKESDLLEAWNFGKDTLANDITLYAKWTENKYGVNVTVNLDNNKESGKTVSLRQNGVHMYSLTEEVDGVYSNEAVLNGSYQIFIDDIDTGNTVVVNGFSTNATVNYYTVSFNTNGGSEAPESEIVIKGSTPTIPNAPIKEGYDFIGWTPQIEAVSGTTIYTAQWDIKTYTVTFLDGYGNIIKTENINHGGLATAPDIPIYEENYSFSGWSTSFDNITSDLNITANYLPNITIEGNITINHTYLLEGETISIPEESSLSESIIILLRKTADDENYSEADRINISYLKEGDRETQSFEFSAAQTDENGNEYIYSVNTVANNYRVDISDYDIELIYEPIDFNVNFDISPIIVSDSVMPDEVYVKIRYRNSGDMSDGSIISQHDNSYVTATLDNGQYTGSFPVWKYPSDDNFSPYEYNISIVGYKVDGKTYTADNSGFISGDYGNWVMYDDGIDGATNRMSGEFSPNSYSLSYETNGGEDISNESFTYGIGISNLTEPIREGYTFEGWYSNSDLTIRKSEIGSTEIGNSIVYAKWIENPRTATVTVYKDGQIWDIGAPIITIGINEESAVSNGNEFPFGTYNIYADGIYINEQITVASGSDATKTINYYTVSFNDNYAGGGLKTQNILSGKSPLEPIIPEREGYTFKGWSTIPVNDYNGDGSKIWNYTKDEITTNFSVDDTAVLYAVWQQNRDLTGTVTIRYDYTEPNNPEVKYIHDVDRATSTKLILKQNGKEIATKDITFDKSGVWDTVAFTFENQPISNDTDEAYVYTVETEVSNYSLTNDGYNNISLSYNPSLINVEFDITVNNNNSSVVPEEMYVKILYRNHGDDNFSEVISQHTDTYITAKENNSEYTSSYPVWKNNWQGDLYDYQIIITGFKMNGLVYSNAYSGFKISYGGWAWYDENTGGVNRRMSATLIPEIYDITYKLNNGTGSNSEKYTYGTGLTNLENPTRNNYTFSGWYLEPDFSPDSLVTSIDRADIGNKTLYAMWVPNKSGINITVKVNGAPQSGMKVELYQNGTSVYPLTDTNGVYSNADVLDGVYNVYVNGKDSGLKITANNSPQNLSLDYYTVTFETNGGIPLVFQETVQKGSKVILPQSPSKQNYKFDGWYKDSTLTSLWDFSNAVTEQTTLYAKWSGELKNSQLTVLVSNPNEEKIIEKNKKFLISVKDGNTQVTEIEYTATQSDEDVGSLSVIINNLPDGDYTVILTQPDGQITTDRVVIVNGQQYPNPFKLTLHKSMKSTELQLKTPETPKITVAGLNEIWNTEVLTENEKKVIESDGAESIIRLEADKKEKDNVSKVMQNATSKENVALYIDLTLWKHIVPSNGQTISGQLSSSGELLTISIPINVPENAKNLKVYREHNGVVDELTQTPNADGEYCEISTTKRVILHVKNFSVYAFTYTIEENNNITKEITTNNYGNNFNISNSSDNIIASDISNNVTINKKGSGNVVLNPNYPVSGNKVTITITPSDGYLLEKLTIKDNNGNTIEFVDNKDGTYTYVQPIKNVTITVVFNDIKTENYATNKNPDSNVSRLLVTETHDLYMVGRGKNMFVPNANMTRAEVAQMFYNLLRDNTITITKSFPDVSDDKWYYTAVSKLASNNIINGYPDGSFRPDNSITRAEFAAIVVRFAKISQGDIRFIDVPESHWAYSHISTAANFGWVTGIGNEKFEPERNITRAEAATLINNMLNRYPDKTYIDNNTELIRFSDTDKNHWAYYNIMEATNTHEYEKKEKNETWK